MTQRLVHTASAAFEAARSIGGLSVADRAGRLHGHGFLASARACLPAGWGPCPGAEHDSLREALEAAIAPLDYQHLNDMLEQPTDDNLARWLHERLAVPGLEAIGIQSTSNSGIELDAQGRVRTWRRYALQAAHRLPHVPPGHKCGRVHGHGFEVVLYADHTGPAASAQHASESLDRAWAPLYAELDHAYLNDIQGLENPTSEVLCRWLWQRLKPTLAELAWVTVFETGQSGASHDGTRFRIWKDLTLDRATCLPDAAPGDRRRRVHGHTYTLRLQLSAPLDAVLGWTVDFGDVKERFTPIFEALDHRPLHELPGLPQADVASLAHWIRAAAAPQLPALDGIGLYATRGCGVDLSWGAPGVDLPL